jgi:hypothetical protein
LEETTATIYIPEDPDDGGKKFLQNVGRFLPDDVA